jgi:hypothetical protein
VHRRQSDQQRRSDRYDQSPDHDRRAGRLMPEVPPNVMSMRYPINSASTSRLSHLRRPNGCDKRANITKSGHRWPDHKRKHRILMSHNPNIAP